MLDVSKNLEASISKMLHAPKVNPLLRGKKCVSYSKDSSKGVSHKFGPPTREAKSSGLPSSPLNILHLRDTDSDGDDDVLQDTVDDDDYFDGLPEKRRKISPHEYSPHLVPEDLVDPVGEPLFDPTSIHHPNSSEWFPSDHVSDYVSFYLRHPWINHPEIN
ncbi:hypothetical protein NDU88_005468 [Pleurodeles waltl]|uniref:Uncharacterized protein n=1 Tax=Pleurodeles waltl TaxID=8319 RepID=A0AAV7TVF9_PLEWA|nr:hypothetical protein NDU88_005468 [Pleurodeles waltl]